MSNWFYWAIFGLIAGALAKFIMPGKNEPQGCIMTMLLGIVGAMVGGFIGSEFLGTGKVDGFNLGSFAIAVGGAIIVLLIYGAFTKRR